MTDPSQKVRRSLTDALGRLTQVTEDPGGLNYSTTYAYDALDNLETIVQGGQTRSFVYDSLSRLTQSFNPESGTIGYQYDPNGNLVRKTDARGVITCYGILSGSDCDSLGLLAIMQKRSFLNICRVGLQPMTV